MMQYAIYYYGRTCVYGEPPQKGRRATTTGRGTWHVRFAQTINLWHVLAEHDTNKKHRARGRFCFYFYFWVFSDSILPNHLPLRVSTPRASIGEIGRNGFGDIYLLSLPYHRSVMSDLY